jgi:hypothetical protein
MPTRRVRLERILALSLCTYCLLAGQTPRCVLLNERGKLIGSRTLFDSDGVVIGAQDVTQFKSDVHWQHAELHYTEGMRLLSYSKEETRASARIEFESAVRNLEIATYTKAAAILPPTAIAKIAASVSYAKAFMQVRTYPLLVTVSDVKCREGGQSI